MALSALSVSLRCQGEYVEAELIAREALEGRRALLGNAHLLTFISLCCLIEILSASARYSDAQALGVSAYKTMVETLGTDHEETLRCKKNIAVATNHLEDKADAVQMLQ